jgi:hypothetical protein
MENNQINVIVTFHFVCGKSLDVDFSQKKWDDFLEKIKKDWGGTCSIGPEFGMQMALVTHYVVKSVR